MHICVFLNVLPFCQKLHFEQVIPLEEAARERLKGNIPTAQSPSFASPRMRARSVGNLNIRETTTEYGDASLTSTLLATGEDDALTVSRHGLRNTTHENFQDIDFQFSPFLGEMDERLKGMLNLQPANTALPPRASGLLTRQVSDPLTSSTTPLGGASSSPNNSLFPDKRGKSLLDEIKASFKKKVRKAKEVTDLFTNDPVTRAGSTGFVTFNSLTAATSACQLTLSHKSFNLQVYFAKLIHTRLTLL